MMVGVLALQGNFAEHLEALKSAAKKLEKIKLEIKLVRTKQELKELDALVIPGGESTTIYRLIKENELEQEIKKIKNFLVTCAGLIVLAKKVEGLERWQKTLKLLDIEVKRNAYGTQLDSFYAKIEGEVLNNKEVAFIRAPKIIKIGPEVKVLARIKNTSEIAIVEQKTKNGIIIGATCHPELDSDELAFYFLKKISYL
ncbi:MAG: pyridoxal 5'-phosphate synthase glutaminase subunit PdxT [Candidatus Micrarchaeota archaeon]|nr:pyridoxal 5'-phosphate synthase glutaminase subunit PdxT [Candidatus Micrarchaeota archaeon]